MREYYKRTYLPKPVPPPQQHISESPTNDWGPQFWETLHIISFNYPDNPGNAQKEATWNFFNALPFLLPCPVCCDHCSNFIKQNPPLVYNKEYLTRWVSDFHNDVNRRLGKPEWSFEEVQKKYGSLNNACPLS